MAADDQIRFPIVGEDRGATRVLKDVGRESAVTAAQTRGLADSLKKEERAAFDAAAANRVLAESIDKQRRAIDASAGATLAHAKAQKILKDSTDEAIAETVKQRMETDKLAKAAKDAGGKGGIGALIGGGGLQGGGMGALIGAGVALAPIIATVGTGLGGLGLAALSAGKRSKELQAELTPLKTAFQKFGDAVEPTLVKDFASAAQLAGQVLKDIRPVTVATGQAMATFLGALGQNFQGQEWQKFFQFMASTAGPDVQLLGKNIIDLTNTLPPLLEQLQPLSVALLHVTDGASNTIRVLAELSHGQDGAASSNHHAIVSWQTLGDAIQHSIDFLAPALPGLQKLAAEQQKNAALAYKQAQAQRHAGAAFQQVTVYTHGAAIGATNMISPMNKLGKVVPVLAESLAAVARDGRPVVTNFDVQIKRLNTLAGSYEGALGALEAYVNAQLAERGDLLAVNQALKASGDRIGFKTQKERDAYAATQTYIDQTVKTGNAALAAHKGIQGQIDVIENALPKLEAVKGKTAEYKQELQLLKNILDRLRQEKLISEVVHVSGQGTWRFGAAPGGSVAGPGGRFQQASGGGGAAAGLYISNGTGPTADDVIARVSRGELIVPARMVASGVVDHLRGSIPGFAAGGIVPSYHGSAGGLGHWTAANQAATVTAIGSSIGKAMASAFMSMASGAAGAGPARHGSLPYLEHLWDAAGGPPGIAHLMAAIAMAESGGNPRAYNPSGASGLWQILGLPFPGNPFNPLVNAEMAVAKYRSQGLGAWVTYTSGAYKAYYANGGKVTGGIPGRDSVIIAAMPGEVVVPTQMVQAGAVDHLKGQIPGFASGGVVGALRSLTPGSSNLWADIHRILRQIADKYTGTERKRLDRLVEQQAHDVAEARRDIHEMNARAAASRQYAQSVRQGLSGFADLSTMTLGAGFYGGQQLSGPRVLKRELSGSLGELRHFSSVLKQLDRKHLPSVLLRQIVAMGPGPGTQWGEELLSAGPGLLRKISARERDITAAEREIGRVAAHDVYGNTSSRALRRQFDRGRSSLVNIEQVIVRQPHDIDKLAQKLSHRIASSGLGS